MDKAKIEQCVNGLCKNGCEAVRAIIEKLEAGENLPQVEGFSEQERQVVLAELKAIMDVYDRH